MGTQTMTPTEVVLDELKGFGHVYATFEFAPDQSVTVVLPKLRDAIEASNDDRWAVNIVETSEQVVVFYGDAALREPLVHRQLLDGTEKTIPRQQRR